MSNTEVYKTTDYEVFKLREDNREKIDMGHLNRVIDSIRSCNLLELRPILVNADLEVIDGQHRLKAAQSLKVPIFYKIEKQLRPHDMVLLNTAKSWSPADYLNFYIKNGYPEYIKLKKYTDTYNLPIRIVLSMMLGRVHSEHKAFRNGEFKCILSYEEEHIEWCWQTVEMLIKRNGNYASYYTRTAKFWNALLKLVSHAHFDKNRWFMNVPKMLERFSIRVSENEYLKLFMDVHNYRSTSRVNLLERV